GKETAGDDPVIGEINVVAGSDSDAVVRCGDDLIIRRAHEPRGEIGLTAVAKQYAPAGVTPIVFPGRIGRVALPGLNRVSALDKIGVDEEGARCRPTAQVDVDVVFDATRTRLIDHLVPGDLHSWHITHLVELEKLHDPESGLARAALPRSPFVEVEEPA